MVLSSDRPQSKIQTSGFNRVAAIHPAFHGRCFEVLTTLWSCVVQNWDSQIHWCLISIDSRETEWKQNGFIFTEVSCILWQVNSTSTVLLHGNRSCVAWSQEDTPRIHPKTLPRSQGRLPHFLQGHKHIDTCTKGKRLPHWRGKTWTGWGLHNFNTHNCFPVTASPADSGQCGSLPWCQLSNFILQTHQGKKYHLSFLELTFFHIFGGMVTPPCYYSKDHGVLLSALALRQAPGIKAQAHGTANPGDLGTSIQLWRCVHAHTVVYTDKTVIRKCMCIYIYTIYIYTQYIYIVHRDCM